MVVPFVTAVAEFFLVIAFSLTAIFLKVLDRRGFLACATVGCAIILGGGISWFVVVAVFFTLGVAFTLYKYGYKKKLGSAEGKGGARSWPSILANGGLASIFAVAYVLHPSLLFPVLFLGSISTSAADTVATELGLLSHYRPRLITNPSKLVSPGTSGGVTPLGFVGAILASCVIGVMAYLLRIVSSPVALIWICAVGGVFGAVIDSILGATVQRKGYCPVCQRPTEALTHCGERTARTGGVPFIENNIVNLLATLAGALAAGAFVLL